MKKQPTDTPDWHERRIEELKERDRAVRHAAKLPEVGLSREARPGLGARPAENGPPPAGAPVKPGKAIGKKGKPRATKRGYEEPRPAPREQAPDSLAHEQERQTGMSGQSSGT